MYIRDLQQERPNRVMEIDMNSTAGEILRLTKERIPWTVKPLVILKLFYVERQV